MRIILLLALLAPLSAATDTLQARAEGTDAIVLSWSAAGDATLQRSRDGAHWRRLDGAGGETYRDAALPADTLFLYRLVELDGQRLRSSSNLAWAVTGRSVATGDHPPRLYAYWHPEGGVRIRWQDRYGDEERYVLEHSADGEDFEALAVLPADSDRHHHVLPAGPARYYRLRAERGAVASDWASTPTTRSAPAGVWRDGMTSPPDPAGIDTSAPRPTAFDYERLSATLIRLDWTGVPGATLVRAWEGTDYQTLRSIPADATSTILPGIHLERTMYLALHGTGPSSAVLAVEPARRDPDLAPPLAVSLSADPSGGTVITWTDANAHETGYIIEGGSNTFNGYDHLGLIARVDADTQRYHHTAGGPNMRYRLQAVSAAGFSAYTPILRLPTADPPPARNLRVTASTSTAVSLAWDHDASDYYGEWVIERQLDDGAWLGLDLVDDSGQRSYTDHSVHPGAAYSYRVTTTQPAVHGQPVSITVPAPDRAPDAVRNCTATGVASDQINLAWRLAGAVTEMVHIERAASADGPFERIATLGGAATTYSDSGLSGTGRRHYRVIAGNSAGEASAATAAARPAGSDPSPNLTVVTSSTGDLRTLIVRGTEADDAITVRQDGERIRIDHQGEVLATREGPFAVIKVFGAAGEDSLVIDASVTVRTLLYGGPGRDLLDCGGSGWQAAIALGGGRDRCLGNSATTTLWVDDALTDTVEADGGAVVQPVARFHLGRDKDFDGPDLPALTNDIFHQQRFPDNPLWGDGPALLDIHQGTLQSCPSTSMGQALVWQDRQDLQHQAVDLGDNTFAIQMVGGYHRIDGELGMTTLSLMPESGRQWWPVLEKAYYTDGKPRAQEPNDHPFAQQMIRRRDDGERYYRFVREALAAGRFFVMFSRRGEIDYQLGSPGQHAHTLISAHRAADGSPRFLLRNPYGKHHEYGYGVPDHRQGLREVSYPELLSHFLEGGAGGVTEAAIPVARDAQVSVAAGESVLIHLDGYDLDMRPCTVDIVEAPGRGSLSGSGLWWRYTPGGAAAGTEALRFRIDNGVHQSATATVSITITGVQVDRRLGIDVEPGAGITAGIGSADPQPVPAVSSGLPNGSSHRIVFDRTDGDG